MERKSKQLFWRHGYSFHEFDDSQLIRRPLTTRTFFHFWQRGNVGRSGGNKSRKGRRRRRHRRERGGGGGGGRRIIDVVRESAVRGRARRPRKVPHLHHGLHHVHAPSDWYFDSDRFQFPDIDANEVEENPRGKC